MFAVDCSDSKARVKVAKVIQNGKGTCETSEPDTYAEPAPGITYCYAPPA